MDNYSSQIDLIQHADDECVKKINVNNAKFVDTEKINCKLSISNLFYALPQDMFGFFGAHLDG